MRAQITGRRRAAVAALVALALGSGCYRHVAVPLESVQPSERVRVAVAPDAAERLEEALGSRPGAVTARITERSPDGVALLVPSARGRIDRGTHDLFQQVRLAPNDVVFVQRLQLDRGRTGLLAAGAAALTAAVIVGIFSGEAGGTPSMPSVPSAEALLPF